MNVKPNTMIMVSLNVKLVCANVLLAPTEPPVILVFPDSTLMLTINAYVHPENSEKDVDVSLVYPNVLNVKVMLLTVPNVTPKESKKLQVVHVTLEILN